MAGDGTLVMATQDGSVWREAKAGPRVTGTLVKGLIVMIRRQPSGNGFTCEPIRLAAFNCYPMH
jgi:hypothetical protein